MVKMVVSNARAPAPFPIKGPITGTNYLIDRAGVEVDDEDAKQLKTTEVPVWCFRKGMFIQIKPLAVAR